MISDKMKELVKSSSVIRAMFEEGKRLADLYGAENVYDFSIGNPSVEPPAEVKNAIGKILTQEPPNYIHGYMNNSGYEEVRSKIASWINQKQNTCFTAKNILMTVGAAGGLNVIFKTLLNPEDEVVVFAPYFGEYKNYVENFGGKLVIISPNVKDFQPNLIEFERKITKRTKAVIINSPNNPTGVVYSEQTIQEISRILMDKMKEFQTSIYVISDEPYRELVYDGVFVPYITKYYKNTIVGYSYSKSLSLPGERIGYLVLPNELDDFEDIIAAANVANRILGFVNAPSLMQLVIAECVDAKVDIEGYNTNRKLLYKNLTEYGYHCVLPEGAFYLFIEAMGGNDKAFAEEAKKENILIVPGSSFGCPGYCRISYCVKEDTVKNALPKFKKLAEKYI